MRHRADLGRYYKGIAIHAAPLVHEQAFLLLTRFLPTGSTVLELGAGSGAFAARLYDHGYRVEAADLDLSDWKPNHVRAMQVDLNAPMWEPLHLKRYACVAALEVIEHLHSPLSFLRNVRKLLEPGGLFLMTTPNVTDLDSRRLMLTKGEFWAFRRGMLSATGHLSILPFWLLEELFTQERLAVVERRFIGKRQRPGWHKAIVPLVNLCLLPLAYRLPLETAFAECVAYACTAVDSVHQGANA